MSSAKRRKADEKDQEEKTRGPLLMIPGPTEFHEDVLSVLGEQTASHVAPSFIQEFGDVLRLMRRCFLAPNGQPFVLSAGGSIGWDIIAANLVEPQEKVLVVNTGYFSENFKASLEAFGAQVDTVDAPVGDVVSAESLSEALDGKQYKLVALTQVDTSTTILNDIKGLAAVVREKSPDTLIAVDGVCSFLGEEFRFDDWGIDAAMTASQKSAGVPPGLALLVMSQRALAVRAARKSHVYAFYGDLARWLPIMQAYEEGKPSYFSTPAVNLIRALRVSLEQLDQFGMENVFAAQRKASLAFKDGLAAVNLKILPVRAEIAANTLTGIRYPDKSKSVDLLGQIKANGAVVAGGLHRQAKAEYFRVGHMGISVLEPERGHLQATMRAIEEALAATGHEFQRGAGVAALEKGL